MVTVNVTINPQSSGTTEIFKNNTSLGIVSSSLTFTFNINDTIKLSSIPNIDYEFSHYVMPNQNEITEPIYEDVITTDDTKNVTVVFESISNIQRYGCIEGVCEESESGNYTEPTCNNKCESSKEGGLNIGLLFGIGVIAWLLFKKEKED